MSHTTSSFVALLALCTLTQAQTQTLLFSGRFPFVSLGAPNERPGGSISRLEEFDFSYVTPGSGAIARSLLPATAMQCYLGDANNDNNYLKFAGFKTYFEALQVGGLFVRHADGAAVTWDKVYFTVRDNVTVAGRDFEVFTNNGTAVHTLVAGDWVRLLPNGNVEFFVTAAQLAVAAGPAPGVSVPGAHALLQTAAGDLYYAPVQGGQWVSGNSGGLPVFCNDGAICKIDAANITYDANGNVASFVPNSARLIIDETAGGPGTAPLTVRQMVLNSGAMDRTGVPVIVAGVFGKVCGLAFDPAGGTFTSTFADPTNTFTVEPNLLFCSDAGGYAGTIFSTANNGSVGSINGVLCGSTTPLVPATGAWLGVQLDIPNFQPSLMGFTLVSALAHEPLLLDQPNFGQLPNVTAQPTWDLDLHGAPFAVGFLVVGFGPGASGQPVPSLPLTAFPPVFTADSHANVFVTSGTVTLGLAVADGNGYGTFSFANPNVGGFSGLRFVAQVAAVAGNALQISTPVILQLQ